MNVAIKTKLQIKQYITYTIFPINSSYFLGKQTAELNKPSNETEGEKKREKEISNMETKHEKCKVFTDSSWRQSNQFEPKINAEGLKIN